MADRRRHPGNSGARVAYNQKFFNPFPWLPSTDAQVWLELYNRRIPFAYRWFNDDVPYLKQLVPGWAPEFTLKDLKIVIMVYGTFFGSMPGVIQQDVLAKVILEQAGWKVLVWWEFDIDTNLDRLFAQEPKLQRPPVHGGIYTSPYGVPDLMRRFRELRARQRRYISSNARGSTRTRRRPARGGGSFRLARRKRDLSRERPYVRRIKRPRRSSRTR